MIKLCKKHGQLNKDQIYKKGTSKYYACLLCKKVNAKNYNKNNFEKIKEKRYEYDQKRKLNPEFKLKKKKWMHDYQKSKRINDGDNVREKDKLSKRIYYKRNHEKILERQRNAIKNLEFHYVRNHLKKNLGFENPNDEVVKTKALIMLLKREISKVNYYMGRKKYVAKTKKYYKGSPSKLAERRIFDISKENIEEGKNIQEAVTNNGGAKQNNEEV